MEILLRLSEKQGLQVAYRTLYGEPDSTKYLLQLCTIFILLISIRNCVFLIIVSVEQQQILTTLQRGKEQRSERRENSDNDTHTGANWAVLARNQFFTRLDVFVVV